jgi:hypothetical protein
MGRFHRRCLGRSHRHCLGRLRRHCLGRLPRHYLGRFDRRCLDGFHRRCLGRFDCHCLGRLRRCCLGGYLLASERHPLLDSRTARALPRLMLVTRHKHRCVLDHLNQAHLCAARQAQHCATRSLWCLKMLKVFKRLRGASIKGPSWQHARYTRKRNNDTVFTCFFEVGWGGLRSKSSWRKGASLSERRGSRFSVSFTEDCLSVSVAPKDQHSDS